MNRNCAICDSAPVHSRDRCITCVGYWRRHGIDRPTVLINMLAKRRMPLTTQQRGIANQLASAGVTDKVIQRFVRKISVDSSGCWLWTGSLKADSGYSQFYGVEKPEYGHRLTYQWLVGPIPPEKNIDHLCRVRDCVNPAHLEAVTPRVNLLRSTRSIRKVCRC